jgi:hypothetical protein
METNSHPNTSRLRTVHSTTLWAALSVNVGAMFKAFSFSGALWRESIAAPEPSRVEWEDTQ